MIYKLWKKYKHYRKLQKARYLKFKYNIFWTKIDIERICEKGIKFGPFDLNIKSENKYCPFIVINYKKNGIYRELLFVFDKERYDNEERAKENGKMKVAGLLLDIENYLQLKEMGND